MRYTVMLEAVIEGLMTTSIPFATRSIASRVPVSPTIVTTTNGCIRMVASLATIAPTTTTTVPSSVTYIRFEETHELFLMISWTPFDN